MFNNNGTLSPSAQRLEDAVNITFDVTVVVVTLLAVLYQKRTHLQPSVFSGRAGLPMYVPPCPSALCAPAPLLTLVRFVVAQCRCFP